MKSSWAITLLVLAAVRTIPPLMVLAFEGDDLPALPRFELVAGTGDDAGFYAAGREFISAATRVPPVLAAGGFLLLVGVVIAAIRLWRRRPLRPWLLVSVAGAVGLTACLPILEMRSSGSAVVGWPILWAVPMLPYRAIGASLTYESAFFLALPLMLAANVTALVATAYLGFYASGRRAVGLVAAGALSVWPLVTILIAGSTAWDNGTWLVDTGLAIYTEPVSTALVAVASALVLRPGRSDLHLALAGVLLSYATLVKVSNGFTALLLLAAVAGLLGSRRALPLAAGGLTFAPPLAAYWPLGYVHEEDGRNLLPQDPFSLDYGWRSWVDSTLFSPRTLLILLPLAILGALALLGGRLALAVLVASIAGNVAVYTFYAHTHVHPRFFFASLPALFVLWTTGAAAVAERAGEALSGGRSPPVTPLQ